MNSTGIFTRNAAMRKSTATVSLRSVTLPDREDSITQTENLDLQHEINYYEEKSQVKKTKIIESENF